MKYNLIATTGRADDDNGYSYSSEPVSEHGTLEEAIAAREDYKDDPEKGYTIRLSIEDEDNERYDEANERVITGGSIAGKLIVQYRHMTYLGYAHEYVGAYIAEEGSTYSDLNGPARQSFSDIEEDVYDDIQDFVRCGSNYKFTTSFEHWIARICSALDIEEPNIDEILADEQMKAEQRQEIWEAQKKAKTENEIKEFEKLYTSLPEDQRKRYDELYLRHERDDYNHLPGKKRRNKYYQIRTALKNIIPVEIEVPRNYFSKNS